MNLSMALEGKRCMVIKINLSDKTKKRFNELGLYEGVEIKVTKKRKNAFLILDILGVFYAIRDKDAKNIMVECYE